MQKPKVYIISKGGYNYSKAEEYGDLVFLSEGMVDKYNPNKLFMQFVEAMVDSSEDDYLVITGLPIMAAIASSILTAKHGKINYLLFNDGGYFERNIVYGNNKHKEIINA